MGTTEAPTQEQLDELRKTAVAAIVDWFEAGIRAGQEPMMMAGQLMAEMQGALGE